MKKNMHNKKNLKNMLNENQLSKTAGGFGWNDLVKGVQKAADGINKATKFVNENKHAKRAASFFTGGLVGLAMNEVSNKK